MQKVMSFLSLPFYVAHAALDLLGTIFYLLAAFISHGIAGVHQAMYVVKRLDDTLEEIEKEADEHEGK